MAMDLVGYFGGDPRSPLKRPGQDVEKELRRLLLQIKKIIPMPRSPSKPQ